VEEATLPRSTAAGSAKSSSPRTVHSKVTVALAPPPMSPAGTVSTGRPPAPGAESENFPTSPAAVASALASAMSAMPPRGLSSRTLPSSSSRDAGSGSVTTPCIHSDPAAVFDAVIV